MLSPTTSAGSYLSRVRFAPTGKRRLRANAFSSRRANASKLPARACWSALWPSSHCQGDRPERPSVAAECGSPHIAALVWQPHIFTKGLDQHPLDAGEQMLLPLHHSAADCDGAGRSIADDHMAELRERPGDRIPNGVVRPDLVHVSRADTRLDRRTRRQPFDARPMKRACTAPGLASALRHPHMPELRMKKAARRLPVDDKANAHARSDRDVGEVAHLASRAPLHLGNGGAIH